MIHWQNNEVNHPDVVEMGKGNRDKIKVAEKEDARKRRMDILTRTETISHSQTHKPDICE
jgi:hypothetical protein